MIGSNAIGFTKIYHRLDGKAGHSFKKPALWLRLKWTEKDNESAVDGAEGES